MFHTTVQGCVVGDNNGGLGVTGTTGWGAGTPGVGAGLGLQVSNANHVSDLGGSSLYAGGSAGEVLVLGGNVSGGRSCSGKTITVLDGSIGPGLEGFPAAEGHGGTSNTGTLASGGTDCTGKNVK